MSATMIPETLSKADEKQLFQSIIENCPEGYLREILTGLKTDIFRAIDTDFCAVEAGFEWKLTELKSDLIEIESKTEKRRAALSEIESNYAKAYRTIQQAAKLKAELKTMVSAIRDL